MNLFPVMIAALSACSPGSDDNSTNESGNTYSACANSVLGEPGSSAVVYFRADNAIFVSRADTKANEMKRIGKVPTIIVDSTVETTFSKAAHAACDISHLPAWVGIKDGLIVGKLDTHPTADVTRLYVSAEADTDSDPCFSALFPSAPSSAVVWFHADWAGPSNAIAPAIREISGRMPEIDFRLIDVDNKDDTTPNGWSQRTSIVCSVHAVPALFAFKNGLLVDEIFGAEPVDRIVALFLSATN